MSGLVSIIVRTKNEERWIAQALKSVFSQSYPDFEVILVDNESTDKTIEKAKQFKLARIVTCGEYLPGKALNMGIRASKGDYIVCLSGHCIPVNEKWIENLLRNFDDPKVAGVYGRQEAMAYTPDSDKRDLALVFGLDRKVQFKDTFFHNANSMIRRDVWERVPFDETVTNIEDRVWAKEVLAKGYKIIYEPEASVYHYHGIHQNGDTDRCANVVRIMERLNSGYEYKSLDVKKLNIVAVLPVHKYAALPINNRPLILYTIEQARASKYIKRVIVSTDSAQIAALAKDLGAEAPFLRDPSLSEAHVDLIHVYRWTLEKMEAMKILPDLVVPLEITFPFRPVGLLDDMIEQLVKGGLDSVIAARRENRAIWRERDSDIEMIQEGHTPRQFKDPTLIELRGVGCVTHPEFIRTGDLFGKKIGFYELTNPYSHLEVRNDADVKMASRLIKDWPLE